MKILVACEESQAVCKAFRAKGHERFLATYCLVVADIRNGTYRTCFGAVG